MSLTLTIGVILLSGLVTLGLIALVIALILWGDWLEDDDVASPKKTP